MSQKVSLRLNVKLPSAGLNGQLQRADESAIDSIQKVTPTNARHDPGQSSPVSGRKLSHNNKTVSGKFSTVVCDVVKCDL